MDLPWQNRSFHESIPQRGSGNFYLGVPGNYYLGVNTVGCPCIGDHFELPLTPTAGAVTVRLVSELTVQLGQATPPMLTLLTPGLKLTPETLKLDPGWTGAVG